MCKFCDGVNEIYKHFLTDDKLEYEEFVIIKPKRAMPELERYKDMTMEQIWESGILNVIKENSTRITWYLYRDKTVSKKDSKKQNTCPICGVLISDVLI